MYFLLVRRRERGVAISTDKLSKITPLRADVRSRGGVELNEVGGATAGTRTLGPAVADQLTNPDNWPVICTCSCICRRIKGEQDIDIAHGKGLILACGVRHGGPADSRVSRSLGGT